MTEMLEGFIDAIGFRDKVDSLRYLTSREDLWKMTRGFQGELHNRIQNHMEKAILLQQMTGLALADYQAPPGVKEGQDKRPVFSVKAFREARRLRGDGRMLNQVFITLLQKKRFSVEDGPEHTIRCGSTLVIDLETKRVSYVIRKGLNDEKRLLRTIQFREDAEASRSLAATYLGVSNEPFAALHNTGA
jgi:hypothetical protein